MSNVKKLAERIRSMTPEAATEAVLTAYGKAPPAAGKTANAPVTRAATAARPARLGASADTTGNVQTFQLAQSATDVLQNTFREKREKRLVVDAAERRLATCQQNVDFCTERLTVAASGFDSAEVLAKAHDEIAQRSASSASSGSAASVRALQSASDGARAAQATLAEKSDARQAARQGLLAATHALADAKRDLATAREATDRA